MTEKADTSERIIVTGADVKKLIADAVAQAAAARKAKFEIEIRAKLDGLWEKLAARREADRIAALVAVETAANLKADREARRMKTSIWTKEASDKMAQKLKDLHERRLPELRAIYAAQEREAEAKGRSAHVPEATSRTREEVQKIFRDWFNNSTPRRRK